MHLEAVLPWLMPSVLNLWTIWWFEPDKLRGEYKPGLINFTFWISLQRAALHTLINDSLLIIHTVLEGVWWSHLLGNISFFIARSLILSFFVYIYELILHRNKVWWLRSWHRDSSSWKWVLNISAGEVVNLFLMAGLRWVSWK